MCRIFERLGFFGNSLECCSMLTSVNISTYEQEFNHTISHLIATVYEIICTSKHPMRLRSNLKSEGRHLIVTSSLTLRR